MSNISNLWNDAELLNSFKSELLCFLCYRLYIKYTPELEEILSTNYNKKVQVSMTSKT